MFKTGGRVVVFTAMLVAVAAVFFIVVSEANSARVVNEDRLGKYPVQAMPSVAFSTFGEPRTATVVSPFRHPPEERPSEWSPEALGT